jgi:outer membrane protein W
MRTPPWCAAFAARIWSGRSFIKQDRAGLKKISLFRQGVQALALTLMWGALLQPAQAAGPRAGSAYISYGLGFFNPEFTLSQQGQQQIIADVKNSGIDANARQSLGITLVLLGVPFKVNVPLEGQSDANLPPPENRGILSLGGTAGYMFTDHWSAELGLDLGFPTIDLRGPLIGRVVSNGSDTLDVKVMPPTLLPITVTGVYTFLPYARVSPYVGFGPMLAILDNRRSYTSATDVIALQGGVDVGYAVHAGVKLEFSDEWFGYFDAKYGRIDNPHIEDHDGKSVGVDKFEVRQLRFGIGITLF